MKTMLIAPHHIDFSRMEAVMEEARAKAAARQTINFPKWKAVDAVVLFLSYWEKNYGTSAPENKVSDFLIYAKFDRIDNGYDTPIDFVHIPNLYYRFLFKENSFQLTTWGRIRATELRCEKWLRCVYLPTEAGRLGPEPSTIMRNTVARIRTLSLRVGTVIIKLNESSKNWGGIIAAVSLLGTLIAAYYGYTGPANRDTK